MATMLQGTVTQASPLLVKVGGSTIGTPCAADWAYVPAVGDQVKVLVEGSERFVLGKIKPA